MTVSLNKIKLPRRPDYGAVELKMQIDSNTKWAFLSMLAFVLLIFVSKMAIGSDDIGEDKFYYPPLSHISIDVYLNDDQDVPEILTPPEVPEIDLKGLVTQKIGIPIPAEDGFEETVFAVIDSLEYATEQFGQGLDTIDYSLYDPDIKVEEIAEVVDVKPELRPDRGKYVKYDREADVDLNKLQEMIEYPDMAIRIGIEGKVVISVWIDKYGHPNDAKIIRSDSDMLNKAAEEALMKMVYTPAIKDHETVGSWMVVPIVFKLRE